MPSRQTKVLRRNVESSLGDSEQLVAVADLGR